MNSATATSLSTTQQRTTQKADDTHQQEPLKKRERSGEFKTLDNSLNRETIRPTTAVAVAVAVAVTDDRLNDSGLQRNFEEDEGKGAVDEDEKWQVSRKLLRRRHIRSLQNSKNSNNPHSYFSGMFVYPHHHHLHFNQQRAVAAGLFAAGNGYSMPPQFTPIIRDDSRSSTSAAACNNNNISRHGIRATNLLSKFNRVSDDRLQEHQESYYHHHQSVISYNPYVMSMQYHPHPCYFFYHGNDNREYVQG